MARCNEETAARHHHRLDTPAGQSWSGGAADDDDSELDVFAAERYFNGDDALWCARSSSSLSSSALRTGTTHERDRSVVTTTTTAAATSSSDASWNSRSALLPEARRALAVAPSVEAEAEVRGMTTTGSEQLPREKPSHLRRWLLGVAGCACVGGGDDDAASADGNLCSDSVEAHGGKFAGVSGKKLVCDGAGELFQGRARSNELAVAEAATSAMARPGSGSRWLDTGEDVLPGEATAFSRIQLAGDDGHHRQAVKSGEFSAPTFNPATKTAALSHEQRRRKSSEMLRPLGDTRRALPSARDDSANLTIVAGNMAYGGVLQAATGSDGKGRSAVTPRWPGTTSRRDWWTDDDDSAAPIELVAGCPYPPSEASVDWSVVTAEGVASCNFSSAASGYYYYHLNGASRPAPGRGSNRRRRCGVASLLTCMGGKAVDAVGPAPRLGDHDVMRRR